MTKTEIDYLVELCDNRLEARLGAILDGRTLNPSAFEIAYMGKYTGNMQVEHTTLRQMLRQLDIYNQSGEFTFNNLYSAKTGNKVLSVGSNSVYLYDANGVNAISIDTSCIWLNKDCSFVNLTGASDSVVKTNYLTAVKNDTPIIKADGSKSRYFYDHTGAVLIKTGQTANEFYSPNGEPCIVAAASSFKLYHNERAILTYDEENSHKLTLQLPEGSDIISADYDNRTFSLKDSLTGNTIVHYNDSTKCLNYKSLNGNTLINTYPDRIQYYALGSNLLIDTQADYVSYKGVDGKQMIYSGSDEVRLSSEDYEIIKMDDSTDSLNIGDGADIYITTDGDFYVGNYIQYGSGMAKIYGGNGNMLLQSIGSGVTLYGRYGITKDKSILTEVEGGITIKHKKVAVNGIAATLTLDSGKGIFSCGSSFDVSTGGTINLSSASSGVTISAGSSSLELTADNIAKLNSYLASVS